MRLFVLNEQPYFYLMPEKTGMWIAFYGFVKSTGVGDNLILIHDNGENGRLSKTTDHPKSADNPTSIKCSYKLFRYNLMFFVKI